MSWQPSIHFETPTIIVVLCARCSTALASSLHIAQITRGFVSIKTNVEEVSRGRGECDLPGPSRTGQRPVKT